MRKWNYLMSPIPHSDECIGHGTWSAVMVVDPPWFIHAMILNFLDCKSTPPALVEYCMYFRHCTESLWCITVLWHHSHTWMIPHWLRTMPDVPGSNHCGYCAGIYWWSHEWESSSIMQLEAWRSGVWLLTGGVKRCNKVPNCVHCLVPYTAWTPVI